MVLAEHLEQFGVGYAPERWVEDGKFFTAAGGSAGIDLMLHLVAKLTGESRAKLTQITVEYDPQPPFGRIDWAHGGLLPRVMRGGVSLAAPVITAKPMRLTESMRGKSAEVPDGTT